MIGICIQTVNDDGRYDPLSQYKFGTDTPIEFLVKNCINVAQSHNVNLVIPKEHRSNFLNAYMFSGVKSITQHFYEDADFLSGLYFSAVRKGLDTVILISHKSFLIPPWAINDVVYEYKSKGMYEMATGEITSCGTLRVDIIPFHELARIYIESEDRTPQSIRGMTKEKSLDSGKIDLHGVNIKFDSLDNAEIINGIVSGLTNGHDLEDILMEISSGS